MKTFIIFALVVMTSTSWARDLNDQLEDCGLESSTGREISELKVCDFHVGTRDKTMHGTVCSFKRAGVQDMAIYLITPGWQNVIKKDSVWYRKCIKTKTNFANRMSCQRMLNFDVGFNLGEDNKLRMTYEVDLDLSFKEVPVTHKQLKCKSVEL